MIWFKSCPKCKGDVTNTRDYYGSYEFCLQCGYIVSDTPSLFVLAIEHDGRRRARSIGTGQAKVV